MALEGIARVGSAAGAPIVSRKWRSGHQQPRTALPFPEVEQPPRLGTESGNDVDFCILDPDLGAILAELNPAVYAFIASRISKEMK